MSYIVVVNPSILAAAGTGMAFSGVLTATVLVACSMTLLMGLYARLPFAVAPGMGLNAFFAYTIILRDGVPWQTALGIVFWAGVLFLAISATPIRERIATAIPPALRLSAAGGIGLLLTFVGLRNAGVIAGDPVTLLRLGALDHRAVFLLLGVAVAVMLMRRDNPLAFLASIATVAGAAWALGYAQPPASVVGAPDFSSVFLRLDIAGALQRALVPAIIAIMFTDLFDSLSTFIGVATASGLTEEDGRPLKLRRGLIVDAWATLGAGLAGSSPGTAYVESIAGIRMGGRTGLASVVTALCFLPCFFLAPLAAAVPTYATAPVLVLIGVTMFQSVAAIDFSSLEDSLPAFVTLVLIPLTFSITQGILWGFILHALLYAVVGRARQVPVMAWVLAALSVGLLVLER
jgi:AGZA family xanthine/uracil permease-like MFS transporter